MKDKREFRKGAIAWWVVAAVIAALLVAASFYLDGGAQAWMTAHRDLGMRSFMQAASRYGDWPEHIALGLVLVGLAYWRGNKRWMRIFTAMIVACALAGAVARVVKISTGRARPNVQTEAGWNGPRFSPHYNSFPSGHTAASTAFFATLAFAGWRFGFALLVVPLLIAFSRMYVAAHHLSDVVCAALIGLLAAYFIAHWMVPPIANCRRNE